MKPALAECVVSGRKCELAPRNVQDNIETVRNGPRVFVLPDRSARSVKRRLPGLIDRQPKNPSSQPARVFGTLKPGECGIYRREFKRGGKLFQSLETLLTRLRKERLDVACFLQVPDAIFTELCKRFEMPDPIDPMDADHTHRARMVRRFSEELHEEGVPDYLRERYVGNAESIKRVRQMIWRVSESVFPVLITGESGTGKEIVARCIHDCTEERLKRGSVFNPINCGAVQQTLFESELFGHSRGAFTGASRARAGLWKSAKNGTLFLDEVADLAPENQAKMLRSLQDGTVRPVGSDSEVEVDARIISATNRDLYSMSLYGTFRQDLYHRLSTHRIVVPPLRDHPEDIEILAQYLWKKVCDESAGRRGKVKPLPGVVIKVLQERDWPGNVRQLHNVICALSDVVRGDITSRQQVEAVLYYVDNPAAVFSSGRTDDLTGDARLSATIRHLRGTERALNEASNYFSLPRDLRAINSGERSLVLSALDDRRHELDVLIDIPLLFGSPGCFNAVNDAAGRIAYLLDALHTDPASVSDRDLRNITKTIAHALDIVTEQIEDTMAQVRS